MCRTLTMGFVSACCFAWAAPAAAYLVGPALSLDKLCDEADLICKVRAIESKPSEIKPDREVPGFQTTVTRLKVIAIFKGDVAVGEIEFQHMAAEKDGRAFIYMPQHYEFTAGEPYILFAKKTKRDHVFTQLWQHHKSKEDQGLVRAADERRHAEKEIRDIIWTELTTLLTSKNEADIDYAIGQLDWMSGGSYDKLQHFERKDSLRAVLPLLKSDSERVASRVLNMIGSRNPYLNPALNQNWLATVGAGHIPGFSAYEADQMENSGARLLWRELAEIANGEGPARQRSLAIRALGRTMQPELQEYLVKWLDDDAEEVVRAALVLLADFPELADRKRVRQFSVDSRSSIKIALAQAIGYGQLTQYSNVLSQLIDDDDPNVATTSAICLLSFSLEHNGMILESRVDHPEFHALFVNALARHAPERYVKQLSEIIRHDKRPQNWYGGRIPWGVSWDILFKYLQKQPRAALQRGDFDDALGALECPEYYSSSEPRDLYALYIQRGMRARAQKFREACSARLRYDINQYFDRVDARPNDFQRG